MNKKGALSIGIWLLIIIIALVLLNNYLKENPIPGSLNVKEVQIKDSCEPLNFEISKSTTVKWTNVGTNSRTLTIEGQKIELHEFDSLRKRFSKAGNYTYMCNGKQGSIVVR